MSDLVTITSFTCPLKSYIAIGRLEVGNIPRFIHHEQYIWAVWYSSHTLGGVKLQVFQRYEAAAQKIIQSYFNAVYAKTLHDELSSIDINCCSRDHNVKYSSKFSISSLTLLAIMTLGHCRHHISIKKQCASIPKM